MKLMEISGAGRWRDWRGCMDERRCGGGVRGLSSAPLGRRRECWGWSRWRQHVAEPSEGGVGTEALWQTVLGCVFMALVFGLALRVL
jgi:hypothetical protein